MLAVIKGAGDIASGIATRLHRAKFDIVMTDLKLPTSIRNTVSFSQAIVCGSMKVEDITARYASDINNAKKIILNGEIAVMTDEKARCISELSPDFVIDAILAKYNTGTAITDAPVVIAVGPGFTAKKDCHAVVETMRGHYLGRVYYDGSAAENTGVPGDIGGHSADRIIRAPKDGIFEPICKIGDRVENGDTVAYVGSAEVKCSVSGILRGILLKGTKVYQGMKSGDVDPRCKKEHCYCVSDKAMSVAGGVLEACLNLYKGDIFERR